MSAGRAQRGFRARDLADSGATLPLGSDWMVADYDSRVGMAWARLRRTPGRRARVSVPSDELPDLPVELTIVDGRVVFAAE